MKNLNKGNPLNSSIDKIKTHSIYFFAKKKVSSHTRSACDEASYILRRFRKLVIIFFTIKNTPNLINLFLFLKKRNKVGFKKKKKKKNKVKMVNQLKFSHYPHTSHFLTPLPTFLTKNKKKMLSTHGSYKKIKIKNYQRFPKKKKRTTHIT